MPLILFVVQFLAPSLIFAGEGVQVSLSVQAMQIPDMVRSHLSSKAEWALMAVDVNTGERIVEAGKTKDTPFIPGSLMKLFITAAALERNANKAIDLGTVVAVSGEIQKNGLKGDVVLKGSGNPFLSTTDLQEAAEKINSRGIKEIGGDIIIDDSLFDTKGWKNRYTGPAYGVPSALGLDMHTIAITAEGSGQRIVVDPPNDAVKVSLNPEGKSDIRQIDDLTYEVTGIKPDSQAVHKRFSLNDPALYAGGTFLTLLKKQGTKVSGTVKRRIFPSPQSSPARGEDEKGEGRHYKEIARIGTLDISSFVKDTNKQSLNVAADNLLFLLGAQAYGSPGTKDKGVKAVNEFLSGLGVPLDGMVIDDGSGLSQDNRISAVQMATFLRNATSRSWFPAFIESLSRPGIDGRLQDFGYRSERMRLKSGQVRDAYCLAGYVDQKNGRKIAFAFMENGPEANTPVAGAAAVEVLKQLAE